MTFRPPHHRNLLEDQYYKSFTPPICGLKSIPIGEILLVVSHHLLHCAC